MKKIIIFILAIVLILCLQLSSYSSLLPSAQKMSTEDSVVKNKIELELFWKKRFDEKFEKIIINKISKDLLSKRKIHITTITENEISIFDEEGQLKKKISIPKYSKVKTSKNDKFIGICPARPGTEGFVTDGEFQVFNVDGELIWKSKKVTPYFALSNDGHSAVSFKVSDVVSGLIFSNSKGLNKSIDFSEHADDFCYKFSKNGNYCIVSYIYLKKLKTNIALYNNKGDILWEKSFKKLANDSINISTVGKYISVVLYDMEHLLKTGEFRSKHLIYNKDGTLIKESETEVGIIRFSCNEKYYGIAGERFGQLFKTDQMKLLWTYKELDKKISFDSIIVTNKGRIIVGVSTPDPEGINMESERHIYIFNEFGKLTFKKEFSGKGFDNRLRGPEIKILPDEKYITVKMPYEVYIYHIKD